jgi:hypothetical protein
LSSLELHEHGKHTVDEAFSTTVLGQRSASRGDRYGVGARRSGLADFRGPNVGRGASRPRRASGRPPRERLPTKPRSDRPFSHLSSAAAGAGSPPPGQTFAKSRGRRTNPRPSRHGHKPRRADQMRPRIPFFSRGLLFERDFRISLSLEFCLDRILSLAKIHASKNTPRASRARLENENGMRRSRPRARRGTKNV